MIEGLQLEYSQIRRIEVQRYESGRVTIWLWGSGTLESVRVYNTKNHPEVDIEVHDANGEKAFFKAPIAVPDDAED